MNRRKENAASSNHSSFKHTSTAAATRNLTFFIREHGLVDVVGAPDVQEVIEVSGSEAGVRARAWNPQNATVAVKVFWNVVLDVAFG